MLYTDTIYVCSDNPSENYAELHSFISEGGLNRGDMLMSNGIPYYRIWSKKSNYLVLSKNVIVMDKKQFREQLKKGKFRPPKLIQDFYTYKKYIVKWLTTLVKHHGIRIQYIEKAVGVFAASTRAEAEYFNPKTNEGVKLEFNGNYPHGRLTKFVRYELPDLHSGPPVEYPITEDIQKLALEKRKFRPK